MHHQNNTLNYGQCQSTTGILKAAIETACHRNQDLQKHQLLRARSDKANDHKGPAHLGAECEVGLYAVRGFSDMMYGSLIE